MLKPRAGDGARRPTTFETKARNFQPKSEIDVLILKPVNQ